MYVCMYVCMHVCGGLPAADDDRDRDGCVDYTEILRREAINAPDVTKPIFFVSNVQGRDTQPYMPTPGIAVHIPFIRCRRSRPSFQHSLPLCVIFLVLVRCRRLSAGGTLICVFGFFEVVGSRSTMHPARLASKSAMHIRHALLERAVRSQSRKYPQPRGGNMAL